MQKQFTTTRSFTINFSGTPVAIEAEIAFCAYSIMSARCPAGLPFDVSLDDLEIFESYVEDRITSTTTQALTRRSRTSATSRSGGTPTGRCCLAS